MVFFAFCKKLLMVTDRADPKKLPSHSLLMYVRGGDRVVMKCSYVISCQRTVHKPTDVHVSEDIECVGVSFCGWPFPLCAYQWTSKLVGNSCQPPDMRRCLRGAIAYHVTQTPYSITHRYVSFSVGQFVPSLIHAMCEVFHRVKTAVKCTYADRRSHE